MSTVNTDTAIKQAVIEQIVNKIEYKCISASWVEDTLCKLTGTKKVKGKRVPLTRPEIISGIEDAIKGALACIKVDSTIKDLKEFIKNGGDTFFRNCIKDVPVTRIEGVQTIEEKIAALNNMLASLTIGQLWYFLAECTKHDPKAYAMKIHEKAIKKAEKNTTTPANKGGYTSVTNEEAVSILAPYYTELASTAGACAPECFRKSGVSNVTNAFRRLQYSYHNQDDCQVFNSVPTSVYEYWKENKGDTMSYEEGKAVIDSYIAANPDHLEKVKSWGDAPYIAAVRKK